MRARRCGREQAFEQGVEAFDLGADQFDQLALVLVAPGRTARQQLCGALEPGQRIAQFVGQTLERSAQGVGQCMGGIQRGEFVDRVGFQQPAAVVQPRQPAFGKARCVVGQAQSQPMQTQHIAFVVEQEAGERIALYFQRGQRLIDQSPCADAEPAREGWVDAQHGPRGRPRPPGCPGCPAMASKKKSPLHQFSASSIDVRGCRARRSVQKRIRGRSAMARTDPAHIRADSDRRGAGHADTSAVAPRQSAPRGKTDPAGSPGRVVVPPAAAWLRVFMLKTRMRLRRAR